MYELRMIAADAESILPRFMPLSFEGVLPAALSRFWASKVEALSRFWASKVVILSSQTITGSCVTFRNLEQNVR